MFDMGRYGIQTLNEISPLGTALFSDGKYAVGKDVSNPDAVMVRSASMHDATLGSNLLAIARAGAGVNNIPVAKCSERGICVFNTPGANANAVKELVLAGLLLSSRRIPDALEWAKTLKGRGGEVGALVEKGKSRFAGPEIAGKTLGVIGLGAIGALVANAAVALGMKVCGYDPFLSVGSALSLDPRCRTTGDENELDAAADYLTIHAPYNSETKGVINDEAMTRMKDGVRILNFARAELVDEDAVIAALESGKVASYVTDFPTDGILRAKNVVAIPHLGASTPESEENCAVMAARQLIDYLENGNVKNSVNLPDAEMRAAGAKVCIIHKNIPAVISEITSAFAAEGLNIENMLNKSKKELAYTQIDVEGGLPAAASEKIAKMDSVVRVRVV
jgi:D-3-phosphoglycerate dehydrogenase